jgi:hypothetical protein
MAQGFTPTDRELLTETPRGAGQPTLSLMKQQALSLTRKQAQKRHGSSTVQSLARKSATLALMGCQRKTFTDTELALVRASTQKPQLLTATFTQLSNLWH